MEDNMSLGIDEQAGNISQYLMKVDTNIDISSVILSDENIDKINSLLSEINHRDKLITYGLAPMNKLLFYGASGTGKTYLTKALANELGYTMLYIDIANSISQGYVSKNISEVFKIAERKKNCIIFLDECDSITMSRYTLGVNTGQSEQIRIATNSLFQQLDQMSPYNLFVSATNLEFKIDPAFERRMNMKLEFTRPKLGILDTVKKFMHPEFKLIDDVDETTKDIVDRKLANYQKLSYDEIRILVEKAMKKAVINTSKGGNLEVKTSDIYRDLASNMRLHIRFEQTDEQVADMLNKYKDVIN